MKQSVQMDRVQQNMRPGRITRDGFLGADGRKLVEILIEDDATVKRMGLAHEQIAQRMRVLRDAGARGLGGVVTVEGHFEVQVNSVRGRLPCPFGHAGTVAITNITVKNLNTKREIVYTDLNVHMIERHGFYEGKGAPLRLEPREIAEILEVKRIDREPVL